MAITISNLKKGAEGRLTPVILKDVYSWFGGISVLTGYSGQATITNYSITGQVLKDFNCEVDTDDIDMGAKEVALKEYNFSLPVERCSLNKTWLSAFAEKYQDASEVFIKDLLPFIAAEVAFDVRLNITTDMLTEAASDADVHKVPAPAAIGTPQEAYDAVVSFVSGFSDEFVREAMDISWVEYDYVVYVSAEVMSKLLLHLSDKVSGAYAYIGGFRVEADSVLDGNKMYATPRNNILAVFNSGSDIADVKVVAKDWENKDYIVGGVAVGGSYIDATKIEITDNF